MRKDYWQKPERTEGLSILEKVSKAKEVESQKTKMKLGKEKIMSCTNTWRQNMKGKKWQLYTVAFLSETSFALGNYTKLPLWEFLRIPLKSLKEIFFKILFLSLTKRTGRKRNIGLC